jgi:hypothetical protein
MRVAVALTAVALVAGGTACGGGGSPESSGAAKREIADDAQAQAKAINLKLSDFPDGWRASTPDEDTAGQNKFRKCIGADYSDVTLIADANSKDFAQGESAEASSEAQITKTADQATAGMGTLKTGLGGPRTKDCLRDAIGNPEGAKIGEIDVGELKATPPANVDEAQAWEIAIPVELTSGATKGLSASVYIDVVFLRQDNIVGTVSTVDVLSPLDETLRAHLVRTVARRMSGSSST